MSDVRVLRFGDAQYPDSVMRLYGGLDAPPLSIMGNVQILEDLGVGFCGSRKVSDSGLDVARDCARQFSLADIVVTSGYAKGVDTVSHKTALESGGRTIIILPEGIGGFRIKKDMKEIWDWNRVLVVSQYDEKAIWRADRAMERNKLIVALTAVTLVIESGDKGGTFNAGLTAIKMKKPLFVVNYASENESNRGNKILISNGGVAVNKNKNTNLAEVESIIDFVRIAR